MTEKVILITGAARRIGAVIARELHQSGYNVILHYNNSKQDAEQLAKQLNSEREDSAKTICFNLKNTDEFPQHIKTIANFWGRLDGVIHNASNYYVTPIDNLKLADYNDLMQANALAPLLLSQAALPLLKESKGSIVYLLDISVKIPKENYIIYCMSKAAAAIQVKALAKEYSKYKVRVNGVAPGPILTPIDTNELSEERKNEIIEKSALKRLGEPEPVAKAVAFFLQDADFITGDVLNVDGGASLNSR